MTDENNNEPKWFIDDGLPGTGERPSWLPDKFKTVADMAKSNAELEKKLGVAPEKYDLSKSKFMDPDYVPFQELQEFAKEKRVSQEVMDKFIESIDKYVDEFRTDYKAEAKELGDNASERVQLLDNWAKANLSQDSYEALTSSLTSAKAVKALEELRGKFMSDNTQVPGNNGTVTNPASLEDIKLEISANLHKYKTDQKYREDLSKRLELAAKNAPGYIDKTAS